MKFEIFDEHVSLMMNVFLVIANVINLVYNIPQIFKTYQTKSTTDFSEWFLLLRVVGNSIWIGYAIEVGSTLMLINNIVTVLASILIGYYKMKEIINFRRQNKYQQITMLDDIIQENCNKNYEEKLMVI